MISTFLASPLGVAVVGGAAAFIALLVQTIRVARQKSRLETMKREVAEKAAQMTTAARTADEAAHTTIATEKRSADATEARAREAAAESDDPLKAGLDALK